MQEILFLKLFSTTRHSLVSPSRDEKESLLIKAYKFVNFWENLPPKYTILSYLGLVDARMIASDIDLL